MAATPPTPAKSEDIGHPPKEQLECVEYCLNSSPSWGESIMLAFQHFILTMGTVVTIPTFLVPAMGGDNRDKAWVIQTVLLVTGINTFLQTLLGTRLSTVMGGSNSFILAIMYIINDPSIQRIPDDHERFLYGMRAIQGALMTSSAVQIILGCSQAWGMFSRFFSPLGIIPVIAVLGFGLFQQGFPAVGKCMEIGLPMLILFIVVSLYLKHVYARNLPIFERFPVLFSVPIIWGYATLLTVFKAYNHVPELTKIHCRIDTAHIVSESPWFRFPYPLQWGRPSWNVGHCIAMMASALVSLVESTGGYFAAARVAAATTPPAGVLSRGIGVQGVGILLDGLFGTLTGSTVSIENVGLLAITRVGSRQVIQLSSAFMIAFSLIGKFGALFASIPLPIFGAMYCVLFGMVGAVGLSFQQFVNMNSMRSLFIIGVSIFLGFSIPQYFNEFYVASRRGPVHTHAGWFNVFLNTIFSSPPAVAFMVSVFLDNTFDVAAARKDRGMPWWAMSRTLEGNNRAEEFYSLPFNFTRFISHSV